MWLPVMFQLQRLAGLGFSGGMNREFLRLYSYSLTPYIFKKSSTVLLATAGFFYSKEHGNIKCFTCDACYSPEDLEKCFEYFSSKPPKSLHKTWCLIADHGNIPIYQVPSSNHIGLYIISIIHIHTWNTAPLWHNIQGLTTSSHSNLSISQWNHYFRNLG